MSPSKPSSLASCCRMLLVLSWGWVGLSRGMGKPLVLGLLKMGMSVFWKPQLLRRRLVEKFPCINNKQAGTTQKRINFIEHRTLFIMHDNQHLSFVELIKQQLNQYQYEKAVRLELASGGRDNPTERAAKDTLIELDDEADMSHNEDEDAGVGRWSNYKLPNRVEERASLQRKTKRNSVGHTGGYRYIDGYIQGQCHGYLPSVYRSEKTIPKLKVILHQLQCPLELQSDRNGNRGKTTSHSSKMKNHISPQALVISNKQEIKPSIKSERKTISTVPNLDLLNTENRRPPTGQNFFKGQPASAGYQKIKRPFGHPDHELIYEREVLSQLLKGTPSRPQAETSHLSTMLNYFTMSGSETKRKVSAKLGLDKLLS